MKLAVFTALAKTKRHKNQTSTKNYQTETWTNGPSLVLNLESIGKSAHIEFTARYSDLNLRLHNTRGDESLKGQFLVQCLK